MTKRQREVRCNCFKLVNNGIMDEFKKLEEIAKSDNKDDPIMIEGEITTGYYCQMIVAPKEVAKIILEYNHPV